MHALFQMNYTVSVNKHTRKVMPIKEAEGGSRGACTDEITDLSHDAQGE